MAIDSPEEVWNAVWDDINRLNAAAKASKMIKIIDPDHPTIQARTEYLSWGTRHEFLTPTSPAIILPTTKECLKTMDERLTGSKANHIKPNKIETFEANYVELMTETNNIISVEFAEITSYGYGNTSKSMDCLNRLFLTPMEVRWLNIYVNEIMKVVDVEWPMDAHIGQYKPDHFSGWLERKKFVEDEEVMSLKDQARKLIQKRINTNVSPYQKTCPCVDWS